MTHRRTDRLNWIKNIAICVLTRDKNIVRYFSTTLLQFHCACANGLIRQTSMYCHRFYFKLVHPLLLAPKTPTTRLGRLPVSAYRPGHERSASWSRLSEAMAPVRANGAFGGAGRGGRTCEWVCTLRGARLSRWQAWLLYVSARLLGLAARAPVYQRQTKRRTGPFWTLVARP